ncbi:vinexin-like [Limulus polyphemus]|uniref:Vinexin-like n=1 Tax=Limulus polyphemus TaxID=6850 RepID=A0ABM1SBB4_LIMPO|nr:vinexin-like [Limulus polyphemus]
MFKSSTTIEVNRESDVSRKTTNCKPLTTPEKPKESCATTIIVNTSRRPSIPQFNGSSGDLEENSQLNSTQKNTGESVEYQPNETCDKYSTMNTTLTTSRRRVWAPEQSTAITMETNRFQRKPRGEEHREENKVPLPHLQLKTMKQYIDVDANQNNENPKTEQVFQKPVIPDEGYQWKAQNIFNSINLVSSVHQNSELNRQNPTRNLVSPSADQNELQVNNRLPTATLFQKSQEVQVPRDAVLVDQKVTVEGNKMHTDSYYALPTREVILNKKTILAPPKYKFIGPVEKGIPVGLRTNVKKEHASDWYKSMFRSLHKYNEPNSKYKYQVSHASGYMSEPELDREVEEIMWHSFVRTPRGVDLSSKYDRAHQSKYTTIDNRRRPAMEINQESRSHTLPRGIHQSNPKPSPSPKTSSEVYKNQPRNIRGYSPGNAFLSEKETNLLASQSLSPQDQPTPLNFYIDGYESDSTVERKMGRRSSLDSRHQRNRHREPQQEIFLMNRHSEPQQEVFLMNRHKVSPHKFQNDSERQSYKLAKTSFEENELKKHQERERHPKYVAELEMRKHNDNFTSSQKSPIPLDRYDNLFDASFTPPSKTSETRSMARVLYNFTAQKPRELSLNKDDIVYVNKKIDKNWYLGEHHGVIGIFPINYVEIIQPEYVHFQQQKTIEGEAKAKFNFNAQTSVELSVLKGETVVLTGKVDQNWYEGRIGNQKGIVPSAFLEVICEPQEMSSTSPRFPTCLPIINGTVSSHQNANYQNHTDVYLEPKVPLLVNKSFQPLQQGTMQPVMESLHINTVNEPTPFRALYNYTPQHEDELQLSEGDTIYVMEKCDDGWYVGTSLKTSLFGTFPGNYVVQI